MRGAELPRALHGRGERERQMGEIAGPWNLFAGIRLSSIYSMVSREGEDIYRWRCAVLALVLGDFRDVDGGFEVLAGLLWRFR